MSFPFSVTSRNNFLIENIEEENTKNIYFFQNSNNMNQKLESINQKLHEKNIFIDHYIISTITNNSIYYNRMNIYFLFISFYIFLNKTNDDNYLKLNDYIKSSYPKMPEEKYNFEIDVYVRKIKYIESGGQSLYLRIN